LESQGIDPDDDRVVKAMEAWVNSQRYLFLTEVNVGSWSGKDTRSMAQEAGCLDLYNFAYTPFSATSHSLWHHVSRYNLIMCSNPLHGLHRVPIDPPDTTADPDYLYRAARYVEKSFKLFDERTSVEVDTPSALSSLVKSLKKLYAEEGSAVNDGSDSQTNQD
jgi:hypothetical protein